jgi:hypothetical protein
MSVPQTSPPIPNAISSQASGDGPSPSPGGLQLSLFGRDLPLVSPFQPPAKVEGPTTPDISGRSSDASLRSAALQLSLESRLQAALDVNGSPEYVLTWRYWDLESGPPICALRASGRRISDNDSGGWPTPDSTNVGDGTPYEAQNQRMQERRARTKKAVEAGEVLPGSGRSMVLQMAAQAAAGWMTPTVNDATGSQYAYSRGNHDQPVLKLPGQAQAAASGTMQSPSPASTVSRGVLNPELPRWLMGFPEEWGSFAPTATPSRRK